MQGHRTLLPNAKSSDQQHKAPMFRCLAEGCLIRHGTGNCSGCPSGFQGSCSGQDCSLCFVLPALLERECWLRPTAFSLVRRRKKLHTKQPAEFYKSINRPLGWSAKHWHGKKKKKKSLTIVSHPFLPVEKDFKLRLSWKNQATGVFPPNTGPFITRQLLFQNTKWASQTQECMNAIDGCPRKRHNCHLKAPGPTSFFCFNRILGKGSLNDYLIFTVAEEETKYKT